MNLKSYYDSGKWIEKITPHECHLCKLLYENKDKEIEELDEDLVDHLRQIASVTGV